jgi:hypothetical protein
LRASSKISLANNKYWFKDYKKEFSVRNNSEVFDFHNNLNFSHYFGNGNCFSISDLFYLGNKNTAGTGSAILVWNGDSTRITGNKFVDYKSNSIAYYGKNIIIQDNKGIVDKTKLVVSAKTYSIVASKPITVKLLNSKGLAITGKTISIKAYGKVYNATTNSKGQVKVYLKLPKLGKYRCIITFKKDK